ncbi:MAG: HPr family phosphocarrier protein [Quinella sp. 1Q5]|nr:HPr family phosphocarrier protein [Quinella sp. 1Q5]
MSSGGLGYGLDIITDIQPIIPSTAIQATTTIENKSGIHARPSAVLVQTASKFKSKIQIKARGKIIDGKSILMLMSMGLTKGTEVTIIADGSDAKEAVTALISLIDSKFGEI